MFRVAVIGAGGMAGMHAHCFAAMPDARVVGVMDIRPEAAAAVAAGVGAEAFTDAETMLKATRPDVIDIAPPTPFHADYVALAASFAPRGIIVEKPMARTSAQCRAMIEACDAAGVPLFVAQVLRFFPEFSTARSQVLSGAVGDVVTVRTRRGGGFPRAWENWYGKPALSGGVIMDLAIHDLDWLRWTFGDVVRVYAESLTGSASGPDEVCIDYGLITLRFSSGVIGHVEATWADPGGFRACFEICGTEGMLELDFNQPVGVAFRAAVATPAGAGPAVAIPESPLATNPYQAELSHFLACIDGDVEPIVTARDGLEAVRIAEAALHSAATGLPVSLAQE